MKVFIAYRHTGEKAAVLQELSQIITTALRRRGLDTYCWVDEAGPQTAHLSPRQIMERTFAAVSQCDFLLAVQTSEHKSEGMLMEIGYCVAKQIPVVIATKQGITNTCLPDMGDLSFSWTDFKDLQRRLGQLDLAAL